MKKRRRPIDPDLIRWKELAVSGWIILTFTCVGATGPFACVWLSEWDWSLLKIRRRRLARMDILKQLLAKRRAQQERAIEATDEELADLVPIVHEIMTKVLRDDKKVYEPAGLFIYAKDGLWHASLSHRKLELKWRGAGDTFKQALAALQDAIRNDFGAAEANGKRRKEGPKPPPPS